METTKDIAARIKSYIIEMERKYSRDCWQIIESCHAVPGFEIPNIIHMTLPMAFTPIGKHLLQIGELASHLSLEAVHEKQTEYAIDTFRLALLSQWRYAQTIYKISDKVVKILFEDAEFDLESLTTLPEWCPYIAVNNDEWAINGFFVTWLWRRGEQNHMDYPSLLFGADHVEFGLSTFMEIHFCEDFTTFEEMVTPHGSHENALGCASLTSLICQPKTVTITNELSGAEKMINFHPKKNRKGHNLAATTTRGFKVTAKDMGKIGQKTAPQTAYVAQGGTHASPCYHIRTEHLAWRWVRNEAGEKVREHRTVKQAEVNVHKRGDGPPRGYTV